MSVDVQGTSSLVLAKSYERRGSLSLDDPLALSHYVGLNCAGHAVDNLGSSVAKV